jgi:hypothetical protein
MAHSVLIIQQIVPHYRAPFFHGLPNFWNGIVHCSLWDGTVRCTPEVRG